VDDMGLRVGVVVNGSDTIVKVGSAVGLKVGAYEVTVAVGTFVVVGIFVGFRVGFLVGNMVGDSVGLGVGLDSPHSPLSYAQATILQIWSHSPLFKTCGEQPATQSSSLV